MNAPTPPANEMPALSVVAIVIRDPETRTTLSARLRQAGHEARTWATLDECSSVLEQPGWTALILGSDVASAEDLAALARQASAYDARRRVIQIEVLGGTWQLRCDGDQQRFEELEALALQVLALAADTPTGPAGRKEINVPDKEPASLPELEAVVSEEGVPERIIRGRNPELGRILRLVDTIAPTDSTVLFEGESGTGKDLFARLIHQQSRRHGEAFVAVNCGAIPHTLIESELFGHEKGAFTGATSGKQGLCESADGGTLFLDEIGEMPADMQVKLLRVLQSGWLRPVGSTRSVKVDIRVIAATNRDLKQEVRDGNFRLDLYYRLNVINIRLPALRERPEDVPQLVEGIVERLGFSGISAPRFTDGALVALARYSWPGNIRELENIVERLTLLHSEREIGAEDVTRELVDMELDPRLVSQAVSVDGKPSAADSADTPYPQNWTLREVENAHIRKVLSHYDGNQTQAARALGINVKTLYNRMKAAGLRREDFLPAEGVSVPCS